jgi:hypothetical protein
VSARHTVVAGRFVVEDGVPVHPGLDEQLAVHRRVSARMQQKDPVLPTPRELGAVPWTGPPFREQ